MLNQRLNSIIIVAIMMLMVVMMLTACSTPPTVMTAKQNTTIMIETYNAQYDDVYAIMTSFSSTSAQKEIALKKKAILVQMWPMLITYSSIVDKGGTPTEQDTLAITSLINQLTALSTGGSH